MRRGREILVLASQAQEVEQNPMILREASFIFEAFAEASTPNVLSSGFVDRPSGSDVSMVVDGEGAELPGGRSGEFTTSATSNLGIPDVVNFDLIKGRAFSPEGAIASGGGNYFAKFFVEMSGISTVSSVDLHGGAPIRWDRKRY